MNEESNRVEVIKKVLNHKQSKDLQRRNSFEKVNSLQFDKKNLYRRDKNELNKKQELTNLIDF